MTHEMIVEMLKTEVPKEFIFELKDNDLLTIVLSDGFVSRCAYISIDDSESVIKETITSLVKSIRKGATGHEENLYRL